METVIIKKISVCATYDNGDSVWTLGICFTLVIYLSDQSSKRKWRQWVNQDIFYLRARCQLLRYSIFFYHYIISRNLDEHILWN